MFLFHFEGVLLILSRSARIQNFLPEPDRNPKLEVMDPASDPELDVNIDKKIVI
jgi:hypothetical protein